jgi:selenophosphate synthase
VDIENISFNLDKKRNEVTQVVVLRATVRGAEEPQPGVSVVTNVTGPGIVTERIRVRALVLTPEGAIFQEFDVVTDVSGPGVISVTKRVIPLDVVNDGNPNPVPVEVVTDVQLA